MTQFFKGFNSTIFSLVTVSLVLVVLSYFPQIWSPWLSLISKLLPIIMIITAIFAAYFNHSRITILTGLFLLLTLSNTFSLPWSTWLNEHQNWLLLNNLFLLIALSFLKDRALISVHGLYRLLVILFIIGMAFGWQSLTTWLSNTAVQQPSNTLSAFSPWLHYFSIKIPLFLTLLILLWRSFTQASSFAAALLVTGLFLMAQHSQSIPLDWQVSYLIFTVYYLLVVIVESYFLAYRDDLTTMPSRRALNQLALSLGRKYTVAMLDIDHFKKFNDTYGHDVGDQVLKLVATQIKEVTDGGKAFRYGGEEFTIVFPRKEQQQVIEALESVRQSIADYEIVIRNPVRSNKEARQSVRNNDLKTVRVTISIGVASREHKQEFNEVLKVADQALYRAKKKGRNNVSA